MAPSRPSVRLLNAFGEEILHDTVEPPSLRAF